jgi:hypothetical protein
LEPSRARSSDTGQGTLPDPFLRLLNSSGSQIAFNSDNGPNDNARITFTPTTSGTYYLAAEPNNTIDLGSYRLSAGEVGPENVEPDVNSITIHNVLWRHIDGTVATAGNSLGVVPNNWQLEGACDVDGDGDADITWRHADGLVVTWELDSGHPLTNHNLPRASADWEIVNSGDFDADGDADFLRRHRDGSVVTWEIEDGQYVTNHNIAFASVGWRIEGAGDFDGDADDDILWRNTDGRIVTWEMENDIYVRNHHIEAASVDWHIEGLAISTPTEPTTSCGAMEMDESSPGK